MTPEDRCRKAPSPMAKEKERTPAISFLLSFNEEDMLPFLLRYFLLFMMHTIDSCFKASHSIKLIRYMQENMNQNSKK
jgi:hypothetical protein